MSNPLEHFPTECLPLFKECDGFLLRLSPEEIAVALAEARARHPGSQLEHIQVLVGVAARKSESILSHQVQDVTDSPLLALALIFSQGVVNQLQTPTISQEAYMDESSLM